MEEKETVEVGVAVRGKHWSIFLEGRGPFLTRSILGR